MRGKINNQKIAEIFYNSFTFEKKNRRRKT